jgi:hypothetical protein
MPCNTAGSTRCGQCRRRCGARSRRSRSSTATRYPTSCSRPPTRATTASMRRSAVYAGLRTEVVATCWAALRPQRRRAPRQAAYPRVARGACGRAEEHRCGRPAVTPRGCAHLRRLGTNRRPLPLAARDVLGGGVRRRAGADRAEARRERRAIRPADRACRHARVSALAGSRAVRRSSRHWSASRRRVSDELRSLVGSG